VTSGIHGAHTQVYHLKSNASFWVRYCFQTSAKDCGELATPANGSSRGNVTTYPHEVIFKCDEGFNLRGSRIRLCLSSGNWSGNKTTCEGNVENNRKHFPFYVLRVHSVMLNPSLHYWDLAFFGSSAEILLLGITSKAPTSYNQDLFPDTFITVLCFSWRLRPFTYPN